MKGFVLETSENKKEKDSLQDYMYQIVIQAGNNDDNSKDL